MSVLTLTQNTKAIVPGMVASFLGVGGTSPYIYTVLPGGSGGSIDPTGGSYQAPSTMTADPPAKLYDTIQVQDFVGDTATAQILIGTPIFLFCEILQNQLGLDNSHIYLWDQKISQPIDSSLYIAVSVISCKAFANNSRPLLGGGNQVEQYISMMATLDIDILSRGPAARDRKEEVILALNSTYSEQQQEANSFLIGKLPPGGRFINLSMIDGAAIPYRYKISVNMQYAVSKVQDVPYFDTFEEVQVNTNP